MYGGYREVLSIDLFVGPIGQGTPGLTPTVCPSEVRIIKGRKRSSNTNTMKRAQLLRSIAEDSRFVSAKFNETLVMMEYVVPSA